MVEGFLKGGDIPSQLKALAKIDSDISIEIDSIYCMIRFEQYRTERWVVVMNGDNWMVVEYKTKYPLTGPDYTIRVWPYPHDKSGNIILEHLVPGIELVGTGFRYPGIAPATRDYCWSTIKESRNLSELLWGEVDLMGLPITGGTQ